MPQREGYQNAVNLTVSLSLTYTICIACARIWIRRAAFGLDDVVIAVATILALSNTASNYVALAKGLGLTWAKLQQSHDLPTIDEASIFGIATFIAALYLSKCAMLTFLSRITKTPHQIRLYWMCNAAVAALGVVSVLIAIVGCQASSGYYWAFHANKASCPSQSARWAAVTALDIITELLTLGLPVNLVWGLQMPLRKKAVILVAFYLRLPALGFSIGRNYYTLQLRLPQTDAGLGSALAIIWMQVELSYALAASTLSALKAFAESFNSGFGLGFTQGKDDSYGLSDLSGSGTGESSKALKSKDATTTDSGTQTSRSRSLPLEALKDDIEVLVSPMTPLAETFEGTPLKLRPETELKTFTRVSAEPVSGKSWLENRSVGSASTGSDDMVIIRQTEYEVLRDEAPMLSPHHHGGSGAC